jgi:hypothetical protein
MARDLMESFKNLKIKFDVSMMMMCAMCMSSILGRGGPPL